MDLFGNQQVLGFFDEYRFLSNFWPCLIDFGGELYPSVEHAYQAAKYEHPEQRIYVRDRKSPGAAKRAGRMWEARSDWEQIKVGVMLYCVRQKFQNEVLRAKLLATGDMYLEETNTWKDRFWGVYNGKGENMLGKLLMATREEIRNGKTS